MRKICRIHVRTYISKEYEVLEAGVQMCLFVETNNLLEMRVVDVSVDSKQTLENGLNHLLEVSWKRCS